MFMLRHLFSNEWWEGRVGGGGGGEGALNHLPLLFCKSVYKVLTIEFNAEFDREIHSLIFPGNKATDQK